MICLLLLPTSLLSHSFVHLSIFPVGERKWRGGVCPYEMVFARMHETCIFVSQDSFVIMNDWFIYSWYVICSHLYFPRRRGNWGIVLPRIHGMHICYSSRCGSPHQKFDLISNFGRERAVFIRLTLTWCGERPRCGRKEGIPRTRDWALAWAISTHQYQLAPPSAQSRVRGMPPLRPKRGRSRIFSVLMLWKMTLSFHKLENW